MHKYTKLFFILLLVVGLMLTACGGAGSETAVEEPVAEQPVEQAPTEVPTEAPVPTEVPATEEPAPVEEADPEEVIEETAVAADAEMVNAGFQAMLDTMEKYNTISIEDTNLALAEDPPPFLLDVRQPEEAEEKGHIEGAVLIPLRELAQNPHYLPSFDTPIITYCGSGWRATIAMTALKAMGYENVTVMKDGSYSGWVEAGYPTVDGLPPEPMELNAADIDPAVLASLDEMLSSIPEGWGVITAENLNTALIENPELIVIDVRTAAEVEEKGYIDAANISFIPIEEFVTNMDMWPEDKDAAIAVYCGSGHRSTMAMSMLLANGYTNVSSLKGGFGGWAEAGYPVVAGTGEMAETGEVDLDTAFQNMLDNMEGYNVISLEDTNLALAEDPPPFLLDVRSMEEAEENGHIESAVLIPLRELAQNIQYLPSFDTPIITYCGSGWRATMAMVALNAMGWEDVKVMKDGSYSGWVEAGYPTVEGAPQEALELDIAEPDPAMVAAMDAWLSTIPEGWGGISADDLNTALIENPDLILVDVRRQEELEENGVIENENLIHIPLEDFIAQKDMWPAPEDAAATYCGSGHRSTIAMSMLWAYAHQDVHSLKGGFKAWEDAGYPVAEFVTE